MKRFICAFLAVLTVLSLAACGKKTPAGPGGQEESVPALIPGKLMYLGEDGGKDAALRGIRITGNRTGDRINEKEPSPEGIRCVFELNEWLEFYPDLASGDALTVWIFRHREDWQSYAGAALSEEAEGFAGRCDLAKGEAGDPWGSCYLNPDEAKAGQYDLVFVCGGKAEALLLTRFYNEGELDGKTDAELEQLVTGSK